MNILITTSSFGKADSTPLDYLKLHCEVKLNPYGRKLTTEEFVELTDGVDGVIAGVESITDEALQQRTNIKVISRCGVGMDSLDTAACDRLGIAYFNTPNAPVHSVAEHTVALILALLKNIPDMNAKLKAGSWCKESSWMLEGKHIGVIGFGRIGQRVAQIISGFGVEISYSDINRTSENYAYMPLLNLLEWADVVTVHASSCDDEYLIGDKELERMKPTSFLVNTSRGRFVDEDALYHALAEGKISGAAMDVFSEEPYRGKLVGLDNVILTPHVASSAKEGRARMEMEAARNLLRGLGVIS